MSETHSYRQSTTLKKVVLGSLVLIGSFLLAAGLGLAWIRGRLLASVAEVEGEIGVGGLIRKVVVERDEKGVPTVTAAHRMDLARATGFLHGQERFFQMDLMRRQAAGELSELFGAAAVGVDRRTRVHRFRVRARQSLEELTSPERQLLGAYTEGVNSGLNSLGSRPPEYWALRLTPVEWREEDSILVIFAMYLQLQGDDGLRESTAGLMRDLLPGELVAFLLPRGTEWDTPLLGEPFPEPPLPGPEVIDLRERSSQTPPVSGTKKRWLPSPPVGSNSWAVAGRRTASGAALLANDMHLGLGLPNIWFQASWIWSEGDEEGPTRRITGFTLPGTPAMISGSNGQIAWGLTNTEGDWIDLVELEVDQKNKTYRTLNGFLPFTVYQETIQIRDEEPETLVVRETVWGPVIDLDHRQTPRALRWTAHEPGAAGLGLLEMESIPSVEEALRAAAGVGMPTVNLVVADREGHIGWTLMGRVPRRRGAAGRFPVPWGTGEHGWAGWLEEEQYPRVMDPMNGILWTANNRTVGSLGTRPEESENANWATAGGFYDLGARARQIRDGLTDLEKATPKDLLKIQLDDRALFLERWRALVLEALDAESLLDHPRRREFRRLVEESWTGHASTDSVGYRLVRAFRRFLARQVFESLTAPCSGQDERFDYLRAAAWEGPLWRLATEKPDHLLDPSHASWRSQFLSAIDAVLDHFLAKEGSQLSERTWGERNTVLIQHPLSRAVPALARWLDASPVELPGDFHMPRVQGVSFGASQRMVVAPGHEDEGIRHMPGGQSGHPLSPYYLAGHQDWENGALSPFLPGPTVHILTLVPARETGH